MSRSLLDLLHGRLNEWVNDDDDDDLSDCTYLSVEEAEKNGDKNALTTQHNPHHIYTLSINTVCRSLHGVRKTHKTVCWQDYFFKLYVKFHWISVSGTSLVTMDASHYTKTLYLHSLGVATRTLSVAQCFLVFTFMIYFYYASSRLPSRLPFRKKYNINSFASQEIPGR